MKQQIKKWLSMLLLFVMLLTNLVAVFPSMSNADNVNSTDITENTDITNSTEPTIEEGSTLDEGEQHSPESDPPESVEDIVNSQEETQEDVLATERKPLGANEVEKGKFIVDTVLKKITGLSEDGEKAIGSGKTLTIPKDIGVDTIGEGAFSGYKIENLVIEEGITIIEDKAFFNASLKTIDLAKVETIGQAAFESNYIEGVLLPSSIKSLGENAFADNKISKIEFEKDLSGNIIETELKNFPKKIFYRNEIEKVEIPDYMVTIGEEAFSENKITELKLGKVSEIGKRAFAENAIQEVTIPEETTLFSIQEEVFANNGNYVVISTNNAAFKTRGNINYANGYGEVVNIAIVTIKFVDTEGKEIAPKETYGTDSSIDDFYEIGKTYTYKTKDIKGYKLETPTVNGEISYEVKSANHVEEIVYKNINQPPTIVFEKIKSYDLNAEIRKSDLLSLAKATDFEGKEIEIKVENIHIDEKYFVKGTDLLDTSKANTQIPVTYIVKDIYGNETRKTTFILIGHETEKIEIGNGWLIEDFTYDNDSTVLGFSTKGVEKYLTNKDLVIPHINPNSNKTVTKIGFEAFVGKPMESVKFTTDLANGEDYIEEIGGRAFRISSTQKKQGLGLKGELILPKTLTSIGASAFQNNSNSGKLTLPDSLGNFEEFAFNNNNIEEIDFGNGKFTIIPNYAFSNNKIVNLVLPSRITQIGTAAFNPGLDSSIKIKNLELNENLKHIGDNAFSYNDIGELTIPKSVETIGIRAFLESNIYKLNLHEDGELSVISRSAFQTDQNATLSLTEVHIPKSIRSIEEYAFMHHKIKNLTFEEGITNIGEQAFYGHDLSGDVMVPSTLTSIHKTAFVGKHITIRTPAGDRNGVLEDGEYFLVDPKYMTIKYLEEGTGKELHPTQSFYVNNGNKIQKPVSILGYTPVNKDEIDLMTVSDNEYIFYYKESEKPINDYNINISIDQAGQVKSKNVDILDTVVTYITLDNLNNELKGGHIRLSFPGKYVDENLAKADLPDYIDKIIKEEGQIILKFKDEVPSNLIQIPITNLLIRGITPEGYELEMKADVISKEGDVLKSTLDSVKYLVQYTSKPELTKLANGSSNNGPVDVGKADSSGRYITEPKEVTYSFTTAKGVAEKNYKSFRIIEKLPVYKALDNNEMVVDLVAKLGPNNDPGWKLSDDGTEAIYIGEFESSERHVYPELKLIFPRLSILSAQRNPFINNVTIELGAENPDDIGYVKDGDFENSKPLKISDDIESIPTVTKSADTFAKGISGPRMDGDTAYIFDIDDDKNSTFIWDLYLRHSDVSAKDKTMFDIIIEDNTLDSKMYFDGMIIPNELSGSLVSLYYEVNGVRTDILKDKEFSSGVHYFDNIPMDRIVTVEIKLPKEYELKYNDPILSIQMLTKFKDPDSVEYREGKRNFFANSGHVKFSTRDDNNKEQTNLVLPISDYLYMKQDDSKIGPTKTASVGYDAIYYGEPFDYSLSVALNPDFRKRNTTLENFEYLDLLPKGIDVIDVNLRSSFITNSKSPSYKTIQNYMGTGRTAVLITATESANLASDSYIADITVVNNSTVKLGRITNHVYMNWKNSDISPLTPYLDSEGYLEKNKMIATNSLTKEIVAKQEILLSKEVREAVDTGIWIEGVGDFNSHSIKVDPSTGQKFFEYKLTVRNNTSNPIKNLEIFDITPIIGKGLTSTETVFMDTNGEHTEGFEAAYYTVPRGETGIDLSSGTLEALKKIPEDQWIDVGSPLTKAVKFTNNTPGFVLGVDESVDVYVKYSVQKGTEPDHIIDNNFVLNYENAPETGLTSNSVYVYTESKMDIEIKKVDDKNIPLSGAEFELRNANGLTVAKGVNKNGDNTTLNDGILIFKDIPVGDYTLVETRIPDGYTAETRTIKITRDMFLNSPDDGKLVLPNIVNNPIPTDLGDLEFTKVNSNGEPLKNIRFILSSDVSDAEYSAISDGQGKVTFKDIPIGNYVLSEVQRDNLKPVPDMNILIKKGEIAKLPDGEMVKDNIITNDVEISLIKVSATDEDINNKDISVISATDFTSLGAGYEFKITDIANPDKPITIDNPTDVNGEIKLSGLKFGHTYKIEETKVPDDSGYKRNIKVYTFKIGEYGDLLTEGGASFRSKNIYFPNAAKEGNSEIKLNKYGRKFDHDANDYIGKYKLAKGEAEFSLEILDDTGNYIPTGYKDIPIDDNGEILFTGLIEGKYRIVETKTPEGYVKAKDIIVDVDKYNPLLGKEEQRQNIDVYNDEIDLVIEKYTDIKSFSIGDSSTNKALAESFLKELKAKDAVKYADAYVRKESLGKTYTVTMPLKGAKFDIFDSKGEIVLTNVITDEKGKIIVIDELKKQNKNPKISYNEIYTVKEVEAPEGYNIFGDGKYIVNFSEYTFPEESVVRIKVKNNSGLGQLTINKYDADIYTDTNVKEGIEGIVFEVKNMETGSVELLTTNSKGKIDLIDLKLGKYEIREKQADGYSIPKDEVRIVVLDGISPIAVEDFYNYKLGIEIEKTFEESFTKEEYMKKTDNKGVQFALYKIVGGMDDYPKGDNPTGDDKLVGQASIELVDFNNEGKSDKGILKFKLGENIDSSELLLKGEEYYIRETKTVDGYSLVKKHFVLSDLELKPTDRDEHDLPIEIVKYKQNYFLELSNFKTTLIPDTGGIGSSIFTMLGLGIVIYYIRKRDSNILKLKK